MIVIQDVNKSFSHTKGWATKKVPAMGPVSLTIQPGEFFSIVGPSGCGKSTLLNILAGLEKSDTGLVTLDGKPITKPGPDRAVVFQEAGLMPWLTARQNIEYGLKLKNIPKNVRRTEALEALQLVRLARYADYYPHQMSGGMRQRVAIARALALKPAVLLMDEPFSSLDSQTRDVLHDELQRIWQETHTTILFVTHNLSEAVYLSDRIMIMTAPPGKVKVVIRVPFPHPRSKTSVELNAFAASVHEQIAEEVNLVAAQEFDSDWKPHQEGDSRPGIGIGEGI
jgi:NitT/TauT family transport system ATP-binding protein